MAADAENNISWVLQISATHSHYLAQIRHWANLSVAVDESQYWVKDLTARQAESLEIKSIPFKQLYRYKEQQLFLPEALVPERKLPALNWMPIEKGLPLELPKLNHNYFGVQQKLQVRLVPSDIERPAAAILTPLTTLQSYIETASAIRLQPLQWVVVDDQALVTGTPILPVQGQVFWQYQDYLLPAGTDWEWPLLTPLLANSLNQTSDHMLMLQANKSYVRIAKLQFRALTIGSFRLTMKQLPAVTKIVGT